MTVREALVYAKSTLDNPKEARVLLSAYLNKPFEWLFINEDKDIAKPDVFKDWVKRRQENEPLEYITQKVSFYSKDFYIQSGVLIPRPETEILVELVHKELARVDGEKKVLEIGTGSGIISIILALFNKDIKIVSTDINPLALQVAKKNANTFGVDGRISFICTNLADGVDGEFDMLVSNPPYISTNAKLEPHVLKEPHEALFSGVDGADLLQKIIALAYNKNIATICCEMGYDQKNIMDKYLLSQGFKNRKFYKDLSGLDRGFIAKL